MSELHVGLWGFIATAVLTIVLEGSQYLGLSRMSLPFLVGTLFTGNRRRAELIGISCYLFGGWVFAALYDLIFFSLGRAGWWIGALIGLLHALFLLIMILPIAPSVHPRMASPYDGPEAKRRIEPPGFMGLNYGENTPLSTLAGHMLYGLILGATFS